MADLIDPASVSVFPNVCPFRDASNTPHDLPVQRLMTPMRAIMVGPLLSTTRCIASIAVCHSSTSCSALGSSRIYLAASSRGDERVLGHALLKRGPSG
jgi:hypothetical protein